MAFCNLVSSEAHLMSMEDYKMNYNEAQGGFNFKVAHKMVTFFQKENFESN